MVSIPSYQDNLFFLNCIVVIILSPLFALLSPLVVIIIPYFRSKYPRTQEHVVISSATTRGVRVMTITLCSLSCSSRAWSCSLLPCFQTLQHHGIMLRIAVVQIVMDIQGMHSIQIIVVILQPTVALPIRRIILVVLERSFGRLVSQSNLSTAGPEHIRKHYEAYGQSDNPYQRGVRGTGGGGAGGRSEQLLYCRQLRYLEVIERKSERKKRSKF